MRKNNDSYVLCEHKVTGDYRIPAIRDIAVPELFGQENMLSQVTLYVSVCDDCGKMNCYDVVEHL